MAERKVSVRVSISGGDATRELDKIAAEGGLASAAVRSIPNKVTIRGDTRGLDQIESQARRAERGSSLLADSVATLWPALLPVGALGIPALVGLTAQFGFAAAGAGVALLAFHGVGDALKALNAYQLEPTAQNLQKVHDKMSALGPAGQNFVIELDRLGPQLKELKRDAEGGLFPGATAGIDSLLTRLPQLRAIISEISSAGGQSLQELGQSLASPEFNSFFDYLQRDAKPILTDLSRTLGNLGAGLAHLFVDFEPSERKFSTFLLDASRDFNHFADGLDQTQGFQNFLDFVDQNGPKVGDALGSIGNALVDLARAGAPISGPTLQALSSLADIIDRIVSSPLGTPLVVLASGLALVNRALAVGALAKSSLLTDLLYGKALDGGGRGASAIDRTRASVRGLAQDVKTANSLPAINRSFGLPTAAELEAQGSAADRLRGRVAGLAKGTAVVGGLALATSGLADDLGAANTVTGALVGSFAGPLGTAAGAAVGALLDVRAASKDTDKALRGLKEAAGSSDYADILKQRAQAAETYAAHQKTTFADLAKVAFTLNSDPQQQDLLGGKLKTTDTQVAQLTSTYRGLAQLIGQPLPANASPEQIAEFAKKVQPALEHAGVSVSDLAKGGYAAISAVSGSVQEYLSGAESVAGQTAKINNILLTTKLSADQLATSLDSVFSQKLNRSAAADAFTKSLQSLKAGLKGASGLTGNTAGALDNRALVRSSTSALSAQLKAEADAGASSARLTRILQQGRQSILDQGAAAGISRPKMAAYLKTLGLTPALVKTLIELDGDKKAKAKVGGVAGALAGLDGTTAHAHIKIDANTGVIAAVNAGLNQLNGRTVSPRIRPQKKADGGLMEGPGGPRDDRILALVSNGEYVNDARTVDYYGPSFFDRLKTRSVPRYASGGLVASANPALDAANDLLAIRQQEQQVRQISADLKQKVKKGKHKGDYVIRGADRDEKNAELQAANLQLDYLNNKAYYDGQQKILDDAAAAADQSSSDQANAQASSAANLSAAGDVFARGTSAAGAIASVERTIGQISQYGQTVAQLKSAGASPLLLKQLVNHAEQGDFQGAIRLGKSLLAQPSLLSRLNSDLSTLDQVSNLTSGLTTDPRFLSAGAYDSSGIVRQLAAISSTPAAGASVLVQLQADPSSWLTAVTQYIDHAVPEAVNQAMRR